MLVSPAAQAQGLAARYAFKELVKPSVAKHCVTGTYLINDAGVVVGQCAIQGGTQLVPDFARCGFNQFCLLFFRKLETWYYYWPAVWPAGGGTPRQLTVPKTTNNRGITPMGLTAAGDVFATHVVPSGSASGGFDDQTWVWRGQATAGTLYAGPASLTRPGFGLEQVTPTGQMLWFSEGDAFMGRPLSRTIIEQASGTRTTVANLPATTLGFNDEASDVRINDRGQIIHIRKVYDESSPEGVRFSEVWLHNGQGWAQPVPLPAGRTSYPLMLDLLMFSGSGSAVLKLSEGEVYLWSPRQPAVTRALDTSASTRYSAINDFDLLGGNMTVASAPDVAHAFVESDGIRIDLNTIPTGAPAGWVVHEVMALNNKGQIVVRLRDPKKAWSDNTGQKFGVLTPQ